MEKTVKGKLECSLRAVGVEMGYYGGFEVLLKARNIKLELRE